MLVILFLFDKLIARDIFNFQKYSPDFIIAGPLNRFKHLSLKIRPKLILEVIHLACQPHSEIKCKLISGYMLHATIGWRSFYC